MTPAPFVVGVGRSGTTLLRLMLDAHPDLAIPFETHFLPDVAALSHEDPSPEAVLDVLTTAPTWPNLGVSAEQLSLALQRMSPFSAAEAMRAFYQLYAERFGKTRWGDKTPPYRRRMNVIQALLPEAAFVHLIRDGRDVALSYRGLWFSPADSLEQLARFWVEEIEEARRQARELSRYIEVRFEDLVDDPAAVLGRLCAFLDLEFSPRMLDYHSGAAERLGEVTAVFGPDSETVSLERFLSIHRLTARPPEARRIERWRTEMSAPELQAFKAEAGPMLRDLGYPLS